MKKILAMMLFLALCVTTAEAAPKYTFKLGHSVPTEYSYQYGAVRFKELVEERTKGDVQIDIFPNNQLGTGERDILEGLQLGTVDIYVGSTGPMGGFEKRFLLFDFPFLFKNKGYIYKVLDGEIGQYILSLLEPKGIHAMAWMENGFRNLTNSKRPVNSAADVAGLKIRTMENKLHMAMWRTLGVDPTPMAWGEVFTALQQGTVDGQENPIPLIYTSKICEVQKHLALTNHVFSPAIIAVSKAVYDSLPKEYQEIFDKSAYEAAVYQREVSDNMEKEYITKLKEVGMQITEPDMTVFRERAQKVYADFSKELGDAAPLLQKIQDMQKD